MTSTPTTIPQVAREPFNWLILVILLIILVPIVRIFPELQTFMHPWRPELAASIFLIGFSIWASRSENFRTFIGETTSSERMVIILPLALFIAWSFLSAIWANSWTSVLHHSTVWTAYLALYLLFRFFTANSSNAHKAIFAVMCILWAICLPPLIEYYLYVIGGNANNLSVRYSKYAELANTIVPLIAAFSFQASRRMARFGLATLILIWLFDIATQSRAGIGIFAISIFGLLMAVLLVPNLREFRKKAAVLLIFLVAATALSNGIVLFAAGKIPFVERVQDPSISESTNARPFLRGVAVTMWSVHPVTGVGADNFGQEFDEYRREYAAADPTNPYLTIGEDQIAERAHNEFAQILAELGVVGLGIFCVFLFGIIYAAIDIWRRRHDISLLAVAAFIGVGAFLGSSLVSSYSFRIFQNGLIFFLVLAIAIGGTLARQERSKASRSSDWLVKGAAFFVLLSSVALAVFCVIRVAAVNYMIAAGGQLSEEAKAMAYTTALRLDPENAQFYAHMGREHLNAEDPQKAVPFLRKAIERGQVTSIDYSYLATAQRLSGDLVGTRRTIEEAIGLYPKSVFLRTRLAVLLYELGDANGADELFESTRALSPEQAATWRIFVESGGRAASQVAFDTKTLPVMDLRPTKAIYAMQTERELRFPDERFKFPEQ